ncbi:hypothetical protein GCM10010522_12810 [Kribbella solani]
MTTLRAELDRFERAEEGFALLEVFLEIGQPYLGAAVLDPAGLRLPDAMTADRAVVQELIEDLEREPAGKSRVVERDFDLADPRARWDYVRLAYSSRQATVWSTRRRTTYFEVHEQVRATYWLPDGLKAEYFEAIKARGWAVPDDWLTAVAKRPKPWWKRGGFS